MIALALAFALGVLAGAGAVALVARRRINRVAIAVQTACTQSLMAQLGPAIKHWRDIQAEKGPAC